MEYTKVNENEIKVVKIEQNKSEVKYSYEDLILQRASIIRQKEEFIKARDVEIAEITEILDKCKELGITEKKEKITK